MGYCVSMDLVGVVIPKKHVKECREAINAMHDPETLRANAGGGSSTGERWYSWVRNPPKGGFKSLVDAFVAWRYSAYVDEDTGDVVVEYFNGEKWGDDEQLYSVIAPFVKTCGEIRCRGEDGAHWRFVFDNGDVIEQSGTLTYE